MRYDVISILFAIHSRNCDKDIMLDIFEKRNYCKYAMKQQGSFTSQFPKYSPLHLTRVF